jgi:hypothetical protein
MTNYEKLRAEVKAMADKRAETDSFINGREGVEYALTYSAMQVFDTRFHADELGWDHAIDDAMWNLFRGALSGNAPKLFKLIRDRSDDAELGRLFADAVNAAMVERCVEDADDEENMTAAMRRQMGWAA